MRALSLSIGASRRSLSTFASRSVLVTGGSNGIGAAIAEAFAARGAGVSVADIAPPEDEANAAAGIRFIECDAGVAADCERAVSTHVAAHGGIDVLVNNVAIQTNNDTPAHEFPLDVWERTLAVNVTSYFLFAKHALPHMLESAGPDRGASIINVASVQGLASQGGIPAYAASKGAVLSLTRQLAVEYAAKHVRVNSINPGTILTPLVSGILEERGLSVEGIGKPYPMARPGLPHEVAQLAVFLASDDASFITGESVNVDGGIMAKGGWADVA
eukprot:g2639.t1